MKAPHRWAIDRLRTFLWKQSQFPDPEQIYRESGLFGICGFLKQCWDPDLTKQVLRRFGAEIHPDSWPIGPNLTLHEAVGSFSNLVVGAHAHVGKEVFLDLTDRIVIEDSAAVGMRSIVLTHLNVGEGYPNNPKQRLIPKKQKPTIFRRGSSVGARCVILCGVEIGEDAVVNAGVVIDRDVPPRTIVTSSKLKDDVVMPERFFRKPA
jgi:acetyltransferase-like isoleucine patch superfamily enzyme